MLHYALHAGSVPWQDQLLYAGIIIAVIAAVFFGLWWRKRASRPRQGDFAALVQQGNVAEAIAAQAQSPLADAADAWQETRHTMDNVKSGVERFLALMFALVVYALPDHPHRKFGPANLVTDNARLGKAHRLQPRDCPLPRRSLRFGASHAKSA